MVANYSKNACFLYFVFSFCIFLYLVGVTGRFICYVDEQQYCRYTC